jgi:hypothetical protein
MMMRLVKLCLAVLAVCGVATTANAAITATWVQNPISAAAVTNDPVLANMQSWSLRVTTDGNWASAGLEVQLPAGLTFYQNAFGGNTKPSPALVAAFPALAFDTYVTGPGDTGTGGAPAILGFFPEAPGSGDFGGTTGRFSVSWGDLVNDPPGNYEIARLTFPSSVNVSGPGYPVTPSSNTSQVAPDSTVLIPNVGPVPEPTSLGLLAFAGLLAIRRRA